jgi:hypothetical protein
MGAIACCGIDCLGATLGPGPIRRSLGVVSSGLGTALVPVLTVNNCIKFRLDLQANKSPVVVNGPFFPRVVNSRYRIHGTNV